LDLGIAGARFDHEELFDVMLGQDRITAIGSPSLLDRARRVRIGDLARWPLLAREQVSATQAAVADALARRGVPSSAPWRRGAAESSAMSSSAALRTRW